MEDKRPSAVWLVLVILLVMAAGLVFVFVVQREPRHVTVAHVLISFSGGSTKAVRSKEAAGILASDVLARARSGEDFNKLMKSLSDDPGGGTYCLCNTGVSLNGEEFERANMVKAFGDISFKLQVGEIGMASFHPQDSPYGWHIIKRLK